MNEFGPVLALIFCSSLLPTLPINQNAYDHFEVSIWHILRLHPEQSEVRMCYKI